MAITFSNLGVSANPDIANNADQSSYSNTSWAPPGSGLIVCCVYNRQSAGTPATPTMSGNSLTWSNIITLNTTLVESQSRLTMFGANASGSTTGATTVDFGGTAQLGCHAHFFVANGVDLSGGVAAAFVQTPTNQGTATSGSVTLSAAGDSNNRPISYFWHFETTNATERVNWTELDDTTTTGPNVGLETQYRADAFETTASASWTGNVAWAGIAAELRNLATGGAASLDPFGMSGFFGA